MTYIEPSAKLHSFTCPTCGAIAKQDWWTSSLIGKNYSGNDLRIASCQNCSKHSVWVFGKMVYPDTGNAPTPNPYMPDRIRELYQEAAAIHSKSPRGAAALLRLAIQYLCEHLGGAGKNINEDIKVLVRNGLPERVQKSLDIVRVTGNDAVHPGQIDTDNPEIVGRLFTLLNLIVEYTIALPSQVDDIYEEMPEDKRRGIENRDK